MKKARSLFEVKGHTAIVTGVSSGLGVVFAEALAENGVNIVIAARRFERLVKVGDRLSDSYGVKVLPIKADISKESEVDNIVKTTIKEFGSIEILVNNAGMSSEIPSIEMNLQEWNKVIDTNLTGTFLCARATAREMIKRKYGKIVNIASIYGAVGGTERIAHYYASKAAVINLTRGLAVEWAPFNINVNAIAPGYFPSEMSAWKNDEKILNQILAKTPLNKVGDLNDLKGPLLLLVSSASNYITGQTIFVDGGWTAV